jgi:hypothetical protein
MELDGVQLCIHSLHWYGFYQLLATCGSQHLALRTPFIGFTVGAQK